MNRKCSYINKQINILEALLEVLPRESCISLYDILSECKSPDEAKNKIMNFYKFNEEQAEDVYNMRIRMFSSEGVEAIKREYLELKEIQNTLIFEDMEIMENGKK